MKKSVKAINNLFVSLILVIFYFSVIGIASFFKIIITFKKKSRKDVSYWLAGDNVSLSIKYFESAY